VPEEAYNEAVGHIIERDFYPDLPKLTQQLEWLKALESGDHTRIAAVRNLIASSVRRADAFVGRTPATAAGAAGAASSSVGGAGGSRKAKAPTFSPDRAAAVAGGSRSDAAPSTDDDDDAQSVASWSAGLTQSARKAVASAAAGGRGIDGSRFGGGNNNGLLSSAASAAAAANAEADADGAGDAGAPEGPIPAAAAGLSLDAFQARYRTEDAASFESNMDAHVAATRRRQWFLHEHAFGDEQRAAWDKHGSAAAPLRDETRALRDDNLRGVNLLTDQAAGVRDSHGAVATWTYRPRNALFFEPDPDVARNTSRVDETARELARKAAAAGALLTDEQQRLLLTDGSGNGGGANSKAAGSTAITAAGPGTAAAGEGVGGGGGGLHEGSLVATGHDGATEDEELLRLALTHVRRSDGGIVRPKELRRAATRLHTAVLRDAVLPGGEADRRAAAAAAEAAAAALEAPRVAGYGFEATPAIVPGVSMTPIVTWGDIGATPQVLDPAAEGLSGLAAAGSGSSAAAGQRQLSLEGGAGAEAAIEAAFAALERPVHPSDTAHPFKLPPTSNRDAIAASLLDKQASARARKEAGTTKPGAAAAAIRAATPGTAEYTRRMLAGAVTEARRGMIAGGTGQRYDGGSTAGRTPAFAGGASMLRAAAADATPAAHGLGLDGHDASSTVRGRGSSVSSHQQRAAGSASPGHRSRLPLSISHLPKAARALAKQIANQKAAAKNNNTASNSGLGGLSGTTGLLDGDRGLRKSYTPVHLSSLAAAAAASARIK
jgi:protein DGCR14